MRMLVVLSLALAGLTALAGPALAQTPSLADAFDRANTEYERRLRDEGVIGGAVTVLGQGDLSRSRVFGLADREAGRPIDENSLFHWASVTKVFTAIAAMQLVERGQLSLDDPVVRFVPELRRVHNPFGRIDQITIRHLLTHSAGFRGATWPWNMDGAEDRADAQPLEPEQWQQVEGMLPYTAIEFPPGTRASYSNLGLSLLGRVVEAISGEPIEVYVDKNILKPLGMTRTYFNATPWLWRADRVHSYNLRNGELRSWPGEVMTGATVANGGLNGPIGDMAKFVRFLMNGTSAHPILERHTLEMMLEPQIEFERDDRRVVSIGLAFFVADERGADGQTRRYFGHSGFQRGHRSSIYIARDGCCAFIFAANTATSPGGNPSAGALRAAMVDQVFPLLRTNRSGNPR